jgi:phosphate/sulfate permease
VGAVVFTGYVVSGRQGVDLSLFGKIALTWVLTLPFAGALAAVLTIIFRDAMRV